MELINIAIDYLTLNELFQVIDCTIKDNNLTTEDTLTIRFVGGPLVQASEVSIVIEYYYNLNEKTQFIIATGMPINGDGVLVYQAKTIPNITFDYDPLIPKVPDFKIKILEEEGFIMAKEGAFWNHKNGHMISLCKVTQCNGPFLTKYLRSLTGTGDR